MTIIAVSRNSFVCLLSMFSLASCDSAPPGVVDDRGKVVTVQFQVPGEDLPRTGLVTLDDSTMTYRVWSLMQPYLASGKSSETTYKGFSVIAAHDGLVLLVPPKDWGKDGWFMICDRLTYRDPHGVCSVDGRVGKAVVNVGGWTRDIDDFRRIVESVQSAVSRVTIGVRS